MQCLYRLIGNEIVMSESNKTKLSKSNIIINVVTINAVTFLVHFCMFLLGFYLENSFQCAVSVVGMAMPVYFVLYRSRLGKPKPVLPLSDATTTLQCTLCSSYFCQHTDIILAGLEANNSSNLTGNDSESTRYIISFRIR